MGATLEKINDPGGIIGWLMTNHPELYMGLWAMDKACDGLLFHDPDHTISWHVAMMAKAGNPFGILCCDALNALSPNHCQWALESRKMGTALEEQMITVQLRPNNPQDAIVNVDVPENGFGFPAPEVVVYKGRYFDHFSPGYGVVPPSYTEIDGPAFVVNL